MLKGWRLDDVITKDDILRTLSMQRELNFAPGSRYLYCNSGYTLLAEVVERVSGQRFREFAKERIFAPARHGAHALPRRPRRDSFRGGPTPTRRSRGG